MLLALAILLVVAAIWIGRDEYSYTRFRNPFAAAPRGSLCAVCAIVLFAGWWFGW